MTERIYYWEHAEDESRYLRATSPRKMAEVLHACGGEAGVIIDDGGPLTCTPIAIGESIEDTTRRLTSA